MKLMKELVGETEYVEELLRWLSGWDTEYAKFVEPKVQLLAELEERRHPRIVGEVERFLEDVNEPARFHAVSTMLAQDDAAAAPALVSLLLSEESVRVRAKNRGGASGLRGWPVAAAERDAARKALPASFALDGGGRVVKSGQDLIGELRLEREVEAERDRDQLVELESLVVGVDFLVGKVVARPRPALVESGTVPRER